MNQSDLVRIDVIESKRLNGQRVRRLARELFDSATDPMEVVRELSLALGVALIALGGGFALVANVLSP
jgi:hypothetical protein